MRLTLLGYLYARAIWFSPVFIRLLWRVLRKAVLWGWPPDSLLQMLAMPLWKEEALEYVRYHALIFSQTEEDSLVDLWRSEEEESMDA